MTKANSTIKQSSLKKEKRQFRGIPASPGVVVGKAYVFLTDPMDVPRRRIGSKEVEHEIKRFKDAISTTRGQILSLKRGFRKNLNDREAEVFESYLMILEDPDAIDRTINRIKETKLNAEYAYFLTISEVIDVLDSATNGYMRERSIDLKDVKLRVLYNLQGLTQESIEKSKRRIILVAREISPSVAAGLDRRNVIAIVTDAGGATSHTAIFARSLGIPAVVGLKNITQHVNDGDTLIVDGISGTATVNPTEKEVKDSHEKVAIFRAFEEELSQLHDLPSTTLDGHTIDLSANIEIPDEIKIAISHGAKGIGLYRSEFLYIARTEPPSEAEQFEAYHTAAEMAAPDPIIIRTFDLGGDKFSKLTHFPEETNPFLGWRAIRACLELKEFFKTQLRAILRATAYGNVQIMFPMISGLEELDRVLETLTEVENELTKEGIEFDDSYEKGIMMEIPSAALLAGELAKKVDFFSIGTNDLIQYTLAVARDNERVAYLYEPLHPAVIKLIKQIVDGGKEQGIWIGVCGEMAGNPLTALLLVGLGVDELSASPIFIPEIKKLIRSISMTEAKQIAEEVLRQDKVEDTKRILQAKVSEIFQNAALL